MSCTGWKYTTVPGTVATCCFKRSMMGPTVSLRSSRGLSVMASRAAFGVALSGVTPTTETTPVTSGSLRIAVSISPRNRCISMNETSWPPSSTA